MNLQRHKFLLKNDKVYKYRVKHDDYILVSPYSVDEDRRCSVESLSDAVPLKKREAGRLLNQQWDEYVCVWEHNGKTYCSVPQFKWHADEPPFHNIRLYATTDREAKICFYRGSLYYAVFTLWEDSGEALDIYPYRKPQYYDVHEFRHIDARHLHAVWCIDDQCYI